MSKQWNLDERQLWQRGNVFKHVLIYFIVTLAAETVCQNLELRWAESGWEMILVLWGGLPYVGGNISSGISAPWARGKTVFFLVMGICGACILFLSVSLVMSGQGEGLLQDAMLSQRGAIALVGLMMISILGANLGKTLLEKRKIQEDED